MSDYDRLKQARGCKQMEFQTVFITDARSMPDLFIDACNTCIKEEVPEPRNKSMLMF